MVIIAFMRHLQGFIGIKCVIRQFSASLDLIVDMIFEWLEFLVEVQTEKNRKSTTKNRKIPKKTKGYRKFQDFLIHPFDSVLYKVMSENMS